ncbi:MAG TPA: phosphoribosyltransferase [Micromonosporaceae bacterium]|nr:phosphoribosyltransferase [Micromonosporaceae bacterium]
MTAGLWGTLTDLVLPGVCAGCSATGERLTYDVCARCVSAVEALQAHPARPTPAPPGLPPTFALGEYGGELRELIIGFKDRGRHRLAGPLGALLAEVVAHAVPPREALLLVYVPDTRRAARERFGDHMRRLALAADARLRAAGRQSMVLRALAARPKIDSARLNSAGRAAAAREAFAPHRLGQALTRRAATRRTVVLLDDIITTGVTLAAAAELLAETGVDVAACAVLAATKRRMPA